MTQEDTIAGPPSKIYEIKSSCEKLVNETQIELRIFKIEQESFREQLLKIAEENDRLKKQLDVIQNSNSLFQYTRDDATAKECSADIIEMLQYEIKSFKAENDELKTIQDYLRKTIENHEKEIQSYRDFVFGSDSKSDVRKGLKSMHELQVALVEKDGQIAEKNSYIDNLESEKKVLLDEIELLRRQLKVVQASSNQREAFEKTQQIILAATEEKRSLQKSLQEASLVIAEHMDKERMALQKMGEALGIAEAAFYEKEEVLKNKLILEQEREFLASTIGQVMEEASQRVDRQMRKMRKKLEEYEKKVHILTNTHEDNMRSQQRAYDCIENSLKHVQDQNKSLRLENENLKRDREVIKKALNKIGIRMQSNGDIIYEDDNEDKKIIEKLKIEIRQINQKCKFTVDDITQEFQKTVKRLSTENAELKAQLRISHSKDL